MPFITTAQNPDLPQSRHRPDGSIPNWAKAFSHRPELLDAWTVLLGVIKVRMQPRRYELVTLATALAMRSSYCALAHGSVLRGHFTDDDLLSLLSDGPVDLTERKIMEYATAIAMDAAAVDQVMIGGLRDLGLTDAEICDIAAATAARCFFCKYIDALGYQADAGFIGMPEALRDALTPGRPIDA